MRDPLFFRRSVTLNVADKSKYNAGEDYSTESRKPTRMTKTDHNERKCETHYGCMCGKQARATSDSFLPSRVLVARRSPTPYNTANGVQVQRYSIISCTGNILFFFFIKVEAHGQPRQSVCLGGRRNQKEAPMPKAAGLAERAGSVLFT